MADKITLEDIYAKLEDIDRRISRLEAYYFQNRQTAPQTISVKQMPQVIKVPKQQPLPERIENKQTPGQESTQEQPNKEKKDKYTINVLNWKSLLGFE
ncbi:MAG: hypothetical protein ACPL0A_03865 [Candidatus Micrarchaeia archaeon]